MWTGYLDNCLSRLSVGLFFAFDLFFTNADKLNKLLQKLNCRQTIVDGCEIIFQQMRTLFWNRNLLKCDWLVELKCRWTTNGTIKLRLPTVFFFCIIICRHLFSFLCSMLTGSEIMRCLKSWSALSFKNHRGHYARRDPPTNRTERDNLNFGLVA